MYCDQKSRQKIVSRKNVIAAIALFGILLLPVISYSTPVYAASLKLDASQFQLAITPIAPKLPADGGTYYAMIQLQTAKDSKPIPAPFDLEIGIISSDPSVLLGQNTVTLKQGQSIISAEIKTTNKAGEVSLSAQAEGMKSDTVTINTLRLDSQEPTKLVMYAAPSSFVPDPQFKGLVYVQLLNSQNVPTITDKPITVTLSSSKPEIGTVASYVTIPAGQSGTVIEFSPKYEIGTTKISASSTGLAPSQLDVQTDGPKATKLVVEFGPSTIPAATGFNTIMTVQLQDDNDLPVKAAQPVVLTLKSSDTTVASVPISAEIAAGQSYTSVVVSSKGALGSTTITASASGLVSGIESLESVDLAVQGSAEDRSINLFAVPSVLPPDNSEHSAIIIEFTDSNGSPLQAGKTAFGVVTLSSSDSKVGSILEGFNTHGTYAEARFKTTFVTGTTTITASSSGYAPKQMDLVVDGSAPAALKLVQIPGIVDAKNVENDYLLVSLVDSAGKPVVAPQETVVYLTSSDSSIASVQASTVIPAGSAYSMVATHTTDKAGQTTITATTSDLASANLPFKTIGYAGSISQYALGLYTVPKISPDGQEQQVVFIQMQDQIASPVPAESDTKVTLSASSIFAGKIEPEVTIHKGSTFAIAKFMTSGTATTEEIKFKVDASSPGFKTVEADMQTTLQPLAIKILNSVPRQGSFGDNEAIPVEVEVTTGALPVSGATIEFGGPQSDPTHSVTDENGDASGTYVSAKPGLNSVEIKATKPGFKDTIAKTAIAFSQSVNLTVKAVSEGGVDISAQLKIQPPTGVMKSFDVQPGSPAKFIKAKFGTYRITAPEEFSNSEGKFKFVSWSDGSTANPRSFDVVEDATINAIYNAQFLVTVSSDYGKTSGTGFYKEGSMAMISVDTTSAGSGLIDKSFAGWSGDTSIRSPISQIKVDGPKEIKAVWQDNYLKLIIIGAVIGIGGFVAYWKILKPRKELIEKTRAPDLDWYKT